MNLRVNKMKIVLFSIYGFHLLQASANFTLDPSLNGLIEASVPAELPSLHKPTRALNLTPSSLEVYNFFRMSTPCAIIAFALSALLAEAIIHSQAT